MPLERIRSVAVTPESATSVVLARVLFPDAEQVPLGEEADGKLLIGDSALRSAFEDPTPHHDLGRLWTERTGLPMVFALWATPDPPPDGINELEDALVASVRQARAEPELLAREASERYGYPAGFLARYFEKLRYRFGPRERAGLFTFMELARDAGELERIPTFASSRATWCRRDRARSSRRRSRASGSPTSRRWPCSSRRTSSRSGKRPRRCGRARTDSGRITFIIDRNVNYTNVCVTDCDFCAFYRRPGDRAEGYLLPKTVIFKKIEETLAIGGTGVLMQGGHHPDLAVDYYEDLFRSIKERYPIHLHALSPPEIQHIARRSKLSIPATLTRLRDAGLDSIPGGGAEILVDRVRDIIAPKKTRTAEWLNVMRHAHRLGMSTTATMMYGHVETLAERIEHMRRIRELQDETRGFRAFISWTFQPQGTRLAPLVTHHPTSLEYLLTQAVCRIYLDNVDHIQSSWVTQGMKVGQVALGFGADDLGSVMIEENVVSAAGTTHRASTDDFIGAIKALGKTPVQRDTLYRDVGSGTSSVSAPERKVVETERPLLEGVHGPTNPSGDSCSDAWACHAPGSRSGLALALRRAADCASGARAHAGRSALPGGRHERLRVPRRLGRPAKRRHRRDRHLRVPGCGRRHDARPGRDSDRDGLGPAVDAGGRLRRHELPRGLDGQPPGNRSDVRAARVTPQGEVLDPGGFVLTAPEQYGGYRPHAAFDGENYLVTYENCYCIRGIRVTPDGTILDPGGFTSRAARVT